MATPAHNSTMPDRTIGGSLNAGLSTSGDALYLYLPGPDGTSAGSDNVYLDFISWEGGASGPPGQTASAASRVHPPWKTESRRNKVFSPSSSRS